MSQIAPTYAADPMVPLYLLSAILIAGLGSSVLLYERFAGSSRRYFLITVVVALWVAPLGITHAAQAPEAVHMWLRIAYLSMPMMVPALYWLLKAQTGSPAGPPVWAVMAAGCLFVTLNAAGPWLVDGLQALWVDHTLAGAGLLGAAYVAFEFVGMVATIWMLVAARETALSGRVRREQVLLAVAGIFGMLALLDYGLARDPFRAGLLTPLGLTAGAVLATAGAIKYRMFAPGQSFATDEVLRTMADAVLVCDELGRIRASNPAAGALLDRSEGHLLGSPVGRYVGCQTEDGWEEWVPSGESDTEELDFRRADGVPIRVSASIEPILFGTRSVGTVIVARDIRSRLRTQRALEASQRRYASLFWHNPALLYEADLEGRIVAVNPTAEAILQTRADAMRGQKFAQFMDPADVPAAREMYKAVLAGESREYELAVRTAKGERRELRGVSIPIFEEGDVVGVFGMALDVTEQGRIKHELDVQRRYFADLFENSPEGIVLIEAGTDRVRRVNAEFTRMFGYGEDEAVGRNLNDLIVPDQLKEEGRGLNRAAQSDGLVRAETVRRRKDGSKIEVSVLARDLRIVHGEPDLLYGIYRDIGDRKETERALREREEELRRAQRLEAVGKLAGGIAHDFNNLLTVINGHARFALDNATEQCEVKADLQEIERAGARAASLTQQLLAYSRRQVLHPAVLDANTVVQDVHAMLGRLIGEHIRVQVDLADDELRVRADRGQLEQVLTNLVVNARDAMPDGGTLTLGTDLLALEAGDPRLDRWEVEPGEFVRLRVADTGTGMDPDVLEHAFEPFFTTKERGKGTGLGLATVFGIVKQSGGHVTAVSSPGAGTVCDIILPRVREAPARAPAPEDNGRGAAPSGTVMVVEDEDAVRKLAVRVLERTGCTVLSAGNGDQALEVLAAHGAGVDLVVTDLIMPGMGGRELADRLRTTSPDLPILFMSGYDDAVVAGEDSEPEFLAKPFTPAALAERAAAAMRR